MAKSVPVRGLVAYIPTRATDRLRSHVLAEKLGLDYRLICDDSDQLTTLVYKYKIPKDKIIVCKDAPGPPCGAAFKRDYVARKVAPQGEWMVWLDDNVTHLTALNPKLSQDKLDFDDSSVNWREEFSKEASVKTVWHYIRETMELAEKMGTINCGFATEENFFFRRNKWQYFGYCRSQFTLYKNDGSSWMPTPSMMFEDMYKTVDVVARYGSVVINRHMKAMKPLFEKGGIGTLEDRLPHLVENCEWMMDRYPGLLAQSKGRDYHVTFAKRSQNTVNQWRKEHGY